MKAHASDNPGNNDIEVKSILRARARLLAQAPEQQKPGASLHVVEFRLAKECYAIERQFVREVYPLKDLTPVPCTPPFMLGVVHIRGQILPVIDIKKFFDLPETGITDMHMVVVVEADNIEMGILVDAVSGVAEVPVAALQDSLPTLTGIRGKYLRGISDRQTVILDVPCIVSDPKIIVDEEVAI
jgi:purine-binding chemotaxis protein CheW